MNESVRKIGNNCDESICEEIGEKITGLTAINDVLVVAKGHLSIFVINLETKLVISLKKTHK